LRRLIDWRVSGFATGRHDAVGRNPFAVEIPWYFACIDRRFERQGFVNGFDRTGFFNPLWIARHLVFIQCFSGQFVAIQWSLIGIGVDSFVHIVPLFVNYAIQNFIPYHWRFLENAVFFGVDGNLLCLWRGLVRLNRYNVSSARLVCG